MGCFLAISERNTVIFKLQLDVFLLVHNEIPDLKLIKYDYSCGKQAKLSFVIKNLYIFSFVEAIML